MKRSTALKAITEALGNTNCAYAYSRLKAADAVLTALEALGMKPPTRLVEFTEEELEELRVETPDREWTKGDSYATRDWEPEDD